MALLASRSGRTVIVYDVTGDPWPADKITSDKATFLKWFWEDFEDALVIIDEGGETVGLYDKDMVWVFTRGRRRLHDVVLIAHGPGMVNKTIRGQCTSAYIFNLSSEEAGDIARTLDAPMVKDAPTLEPGEFIHVPKPPRPAVRMRVRQDASGIDDSPKGRKCN